MENTAFITKYKSRLFETTLEFFFFYRVAV